MNAIIIIIIVIRSNSSYLRPINTILSGIIKPVLRVFRTGCYGERLDSVGRGVKNCIKRSFFSNSNIREIN